MLWDLEFKFGSIQLVGHFCLFNNIHIFASDNPKRLYWHFHFLFIIYQYLNFSKNFHFKCFGFLFSDTFTFLWVGILNYRI